MLSLSECREFLDAEVSSELTDTDLKNIREALYLLAEIYIKNN